jgi:4-oxalocrotonate tautomerase
MAVLPLTTARDGALARHTRLHTAGGEGRAIRDSSWKEHDMPMVTVKVIEGVFTAEQKREMISKITDTMVEIEGENLRPVTWVLVEEVRSGDWGIAGNGLTTADVHALQGRPVAAAAG